jgi:hypothetical protein
MHVEYRYRRQGSMARDVRGPAAYFPSIEAKYGRSIAEWKGLMEASGLRSWKELMALLKEQHGMGHGHANALAIDFLDDQRRKEG